MAKRRGWLDTQYDVVGTPYLEAQDEAQDAGGLEAKPSEADAFFLEVLPRLGGKKLLDVGCGAGHELANYEARGADVWGIDPSRLMLRAAQARVAPDRLVVGTAERLPFADGIFDVVVSRLALHYLPKIDRAYEEASRVLVEGGKFVFIVRHPVHDLFYQQNKLYGHQETITVGIYDDAVEMQMPSHSMSDYLSPAFCENFTLEALREQRTEHHRNWSGSVPRALAICAAKRCA